MLYETLESKGAVLVDYTNETDTMQDINYACLTAPSPVRCEVWVDDQLFDAVYVYQTTHSWWTQAGGKFLPSQGLQPKQHLIVKVNAPCALRLDWM